MYWNDGLCTWKNWPRRAKTQHSGKVIGLSKQIPIFHISRNKNKKTVTWKEKDSKLLSDYLTLMCQRAIEWYIYQTPGKKMWAKYFICN